MGGRMCGCADTGFSIGQTHYAGRDFGDNMTDFLSNPQTHPEGFFFIDENAQCGSSCSHQTISNVSNLSLKWCMLMNSALCKCCMWGHTRIKIHASPSNHPHLDTCGHDHFFTTNLCITCVHFSSPFLQAFLYAATLSWAAENKAPCRCRQ